MNPRSLPEERIRRLVERTGWTEAFAKGYYEGELARKQGTGPSSYSMVGNDESSQGYRHGYFGRPIPSVRQSGTDGGRESGEGQA